MSQISLTHVSDFLIHVSDFPTHVSDFPNPSLLAWIIGENAIIDEECNEALNNKELFWLIPSKNRSNLVDTRGKSFKWISEKKYDFFTWLQLKNLVNMMLFYI